MYSGKPYSDSRKSRPQRVLLAVVASGLFAARAAVAQPSPPVEPMDPSAPHERLRFFEGTWTTADSTPEDDFREVCAWQPSGRRHMVCRSRWQTKSGAREGLSIFSYDPVTAEYVYNGFRSGGAHVSQRGREHDGRWTFHAERGTGSERVRTRVTIEPDSQGFNFLVQESKNEAPWSEGARVIYRRLAP